MASQQTQSLYPSLEDFYFGDGQDQYSTKPLSGETRSVGQTSQGSRAISSEVLWPRNGDNLRIASRLSRERDGFLRVKKDKSKDTLSVDAKGSMDQTNSLFKVFHLPSTERSRHAHDEMWVFIGIPGERVAKDETKVFLLKTSTKSGKKAIVAKCYNKPQEGNPPDVAAADVSSFQFLLEYEGGGNFAIRDTDTWMDEELTVRYHYIKVNGDGKLTRVKRNRHVDREEYANPGMQFSLNYLGNDNDLLDGE